MKENINFLKTSFNIYIETILRLLAVYINTYMISKYNILLLAAMSGANQIFILTSSAMSFLSFGTSVFISQALGAKEKKLAIKAAHLNICFSFFMGLCCFAFAFFKGSWILQILNIPADIKELSLLYLKTISFLIFIDSLYLAFSGIIRVFAKTKELMLVAFIMNFINILLNFIFLFHFELGLFGVGLSSVISRFIALICLIFIYHNSLKLRIYFYLFFKIRLDILKKIMSIGVFSAGENLLGSIQYMVIFSFIAKLGSQYLSVQTIYFQISIFLFTSSIAISQANRIIIGRMIGKKDFQAAIIQTNKALKFAICLNLIAVSLIFLLSDFLINILSLDKNLAKIIKPLFYISFILEFARAINQVISTALKTSADMLYVSCVSAICMWGVCLPLAYVLAIHFSFALSGIWLAFCVEELIKIFFNLKRWRSKKWQNKVLI